MITLQFVPYSEIANLSSEKRIKKLLDGVKDEKIILLEGRLTKEEEAQLIKITMESINSKFKGIELSVVTSEKKEAGIWKKIKHNLISLLSGGKPGITIIGPATIIKEIKKDPDKIQLLTVEAKKLGTRRSRKKKNGI